MPNWKKLIVSGSDASLNSLSSATYISASSFSGNLTGSVFGTSSWANNTITASHALTASSVTTLNQNVIITGSLTVGSSSLGSNENTLVLGPSPAGGAGEGGQILLQAPGGTYTSASMWDNYQNSTRLLRGTNAGSDAVVASFNMHSKQVQFAQYNSLGAFSGTPVAALGVDSGGNVITIQTGSQAGGSGVTINNNTDNYILTATGTANTINGESNLQFNGSTLSVTGNVSATSITASGAILAQANGAMYFRGGDDAELWDINVANTVGIYGQQDATVASIKLGSGGGIISGRSGSIGIGTTLPVSGTLQVNGNVFATSFTGSLQGTSSWAVTASYAITSSYGLNPKVSGSLNNVDAVIFNTSPTVAMSASVLSWDNGEGTLQLGLVGGNVVANIGEQLYQYVYNAQGTTLTKGQVVYGSGSQGGRIAVKLASATAELGSANTIGLVAESILAGAEGWIITEGTLKNVNTSQFTSSPFAYLSSSAGEFTPNYPEAPAHGVRLGIVQKVDASTGAIYVKIDNGYELDELHDVIDRTTTASYGDLLVKSGSVWTTGKQMTGSYFITGTLQATSFTGSLFGTASYAITASYATMSINQLSDVSASAATDLQPLAYDAVLKKWTNATLLNASISGNAATATNANTASFVTGSNVYGPFGANSIISASYSVTSSYAVTSSFAVTASFAQTASYADSGFNIGIAEYFTTSSTTAAGTTTVSSIATGSFTSAFYNYTIRSGSNARSGQMMSVWSGSSIQYTEVTTLDIGSTSTASFAVALSGNNVNLNFTAPGIWTVKSIANLL